VSVLDAVNDDVLDFKSERGGEKTSWEPGDGRFRHVVALVGVA